MQIIPNKLKNWQKVILTISIIGILFQLGFLLIDAKTSSKKSLSSSSSQTNTAFGSDKDNPFEEASYPQPSCGDRTPTDPTEYPVRFYPVYIDYNKNNLQQAQSQYCKDALRVNRETGEIAVQVGSFASRKRARQFRNFLETEFSTAEVGEPTILKEPNS